MAFSAFKAGAVHEVPILASSFKTYWFDFQQGETFPATWNLSNPQRYQSVGFPEVLQQLYRASPSTGKAGPAGEWFSPPAPAPALGLNQSHEELVDMANN